MSCHRSGYRFLLSHYLPRFKKISISQQSILSPYEMHPVLVFEPPGTCNRTVITFSGFSVHGYQDKRIAAVSRAFAHQGFRVITPCVSDIDRLLIHPATIDKFAALIQAVYADRMLNPSGQPIGIFAASYSGGIAMLAASRADIAPYVNAICLVGAFTHFRNVLQFIIEQEEIDEYARYILLRNFLQQSKHHDDEIVELLNIAIQDNGFKKERPLLPDRLQTVSAGAVNFFMQLLNNASFRSELAYQAFEEINQRERWTDYFDLEHRLDYVDFSVSLIHGQGDRVIPSNESVHLHALLQRRGKNSHLVLTSLLDHGDLNLSKDIWRETNKLAAGFGFFINDLRAAQPH